MDFFQLLQLNFKNVVTIAKLFLTAIIVTLWTKESLSFEDIFSVKNVNFLWYFILVYLLFYLFISAGIGFIDKILFARLKLRAESKNIDNSLGAEIADIIRKGETSFGFNMSSHFAKMIIHYNDIVNIGIDFAIIFIQLAIVKNNFWFASPTLAICILLPFIMVKLHLLNEHWKNEHHRSN